MARDGWDNAMTKRKLPPALQRRADAVKQAHEDLKAHPLYQRLPAAEKLRLTQHVVRTRQRER